MSLETVARCLQISLGPRNDKLNKYNTGIAAFFYYKGTFQTCKNISSLPQPLLVTYKKSLRYCQQSSLFYKQQTWFFPYGLLFLAFILFLASSLLFIFFLFNPGYRQSAMACFLPCCFLGHGVSCLGRAWVFPSVPNGRSYDGGSLLHP